MQQPVQHRTARIAAEAVVKVFVGAEDAYEPQPELPAEPEVVTTLKRACKKLSDRKQQISEFIQIIAMPQKRAEQQQ